MRNSLATFVFGIAFALAACTGADPVVPVAPSEPDAPPPASTLVVAAATAETHPDDQGLTAFTSPGDLPHLELKVGGESLPLEHTEVSARIRGAVAEVEVRQTYANDHDEAIEAVYIFPLPENSAVNQMKMVIGKREIQAEIKKREDAKAIYEAARRQGHTAALLEQERPNIFTQSVANIAPHEEIEVAVTYVQDLSYDRGEYEFVFPMVVGPRFHQGAPTQGPQAGDGAHPDTSLVPDASRISPPVAGPGTRTGHDISIAVDVDAGVPIASHETPTHEVELREGPTKSRLQVRLASEDDLPNRDFVLRYGVAGKGPQSAMLTRAAKGGGHFSLLVQPPDLDIEKLVGKRELIFVVDVSGSMSGVPLAMCQTAMRESLRRLRPVDTFNIVSFSGRTATAFESPRPANEHNLREALSFVDRMRAGGGTHMADAVYDALDAEIEDGRHRYVFFLTDGYVSIEDRIFALEKKLIRRLAKRGQKARVFGFGVGSSPNRHLIEGLSDAGDGISVFASNREDPVRGVNSFFHRIDHPVITDIEIDWGQGKVTETYPHALPDLFASKPLVLHGRYSKKPSKVEVRGRMNGRKVTIPVTVSAANAKDGAKVIPVLWARSKIEDLRRRLWDGHDEKVVASITQVALDHAIVTAYTSFVAVDTSRVVGDGDPRKIVQPVEMPEDVDAVMAGAPIVRNVMAPALTTRSFDAAGTIAPSPASAGTGRMLRVEAAPVKRRARKSGPKKKTAPKPDPAPRVVVRISSPEGRSTRSAASITRTVKRAESALARCFERSVPPHDGDARAVVLALTVSKTGAVFFASLTRGSLGSEAGDSCLTKVASSWTFGKAGRRASENPVVIEIPLNLRWR